MTANPTLLSMPLAQNGQKNTIPATQATAGDGLFSQSTGFPAETSLPLGAGGVAPSREDFNGMANLLGGVAYYAQKGWQFQFDAGQEYFAGCIVRDTTDGKLYECLNDVAAGGSVPSSDAVHWKKSGVDPSLFANTSLSNLTATGENHFANKNLNNLSPTGEDHFLGNSNFTILYPNNGTAANPANVTVATTYILANPFPGYSVYCQPEVYYNGEWGVAPIQGYNVSGYYGNGLYCYQHNNGSISLNTGSSALINANTYKYNVSPATFTTYTKQTSLPCRVKVWKVGKN